MSDYTKLYQIIGYKFKDNSYLVRALTHRSKSKNNYERLEFLGDAVLGFVVAEELFNRFPSAAEGKLSLVRTKLVKGVTLAKIARTLHLEEYVILGNSELKGGTQNRDRILEDVLEAIIGAIYLDSDFATAKISVLKLYEHIFDSLTMDVLSSKDNKSKLQEVLLQNSYSLPTYEIAEIAGKDHEQIFTVSVESKELEIKLESKSSSRKKAEQRAAGEMIVILEQKGIYEKK